MLQMYYFSEMPLKFQDVVFARFNYQIGISPSKIYPLLQEIHAGISLKPKSGIL